MFKTLEFRKASLLVILSLLFMFCMAMPAAAATDDLYGYRLAGDEAIITDYYSEGAEVQIPSGIDGKMVTSIDAEAFLNCPNLESVTVPVTITYLPQGLFPQGITLRCGVDSYVKDYCLAENLNFELIDVKSELSAGEFFPDVKDGDWFNEYVRDLWNKGILEGYENGLFLPQNHITRAEFVKMLAVAAGLKEDTVLNESDIPFRDVPSDQWYAPYVVWAVENSLITGYEDETFRPQQNISRQEMMVVQYRYAASVMKKELPVIVSEMIFADADDIGSWALDEARALQMTGVINGMGDNMLMPKAYSTRAEVAAMVSRFLGLMEGDNSVKAIEGMIYVPGETICWRDGAVAYGKTAPSYEDGILLIPIEEYCDYKNISYSWQSSSALVINLTADTWLKITVGSQTVSLSNGTSVTLNQTPYMKDGSLMADISVLAYLFGDKVSVSAAGDVIFVYPEDISIDEGNWLAGYESYIYNKENTVKVYSSSYGKSGKGRELTYTVIGPNNYDKTIMLVFEQHGFEDSYDRDGQVLVNTANKLIEHYKNADSAYFNKTRLVIVASANPDGLAEGYTNNGPGRCTIVGKVDMNRDWPTSTYRASSESRYYTLSPLSCNETKNLKTLIDNIAPDVLLDCHGWLNGVYGDRNLAAIFKREMGLPSKSLFSTSSLNATDVTNLSAEEIDDAYLSGLVGFSGYLAGYGYEKGITSALVEFSSPNGINFTKLVNAVQAIGKSI